MTVGELSTGDPLERFFELSLDLFCIADMRGYFRQLNSAFEQVPGYSRAELQSRPFVDFVHPDDRQATLDQVQQLVDGEPTVAFVNRYRCRDGGYRRLQWSAMRVPEEAAIYAVARDITTQRQQDSREPGDVLVLYTDGVVEAFNSDQQLYGPDRLAGKLLERRDASSDRLALDLHEDVRHYCGDRSPNDDICLLALKVS